eukprot:TRINITY_DN5487_c0_g1_i1.p1 TRINITY_DN5487_c0_g1~~TRINITY_DN5487_c0_g1_i1.p1  ORF type:complete len:941 (-),score=207.79 TRINITY_DN5487_c0_g1_i1:323-3145(-)
MKGSTLSSNPPTPPPTPPPLLPNISFVHLSRLDPESFRSLPESEQVTYRRMEVIKEIIQSENDYIKDLRVIVEVFVTPLKAKLPKQVITAMFSNIQIILNINGELLKLLKPEFTRPLEEQSFGIVFLRFADYLKAYTQYSSDQDLAIQTLRKQRANPDIARFLDECQRDPRCNNGTLLSFLIKPIQRICKYPLLLQQLQRYLPPNHLDREALSGAIAKLSSVVEVIDARKRKFESEIQLIDIQSRIAGAEGLLEPGRRLVREGPILKLGFGNTLRKQYLFLFNDMFIYSTPISHNRFSKRGAVFLLKAKVELPSARIDRPSIPSDLPYAFLVTKSGKSGKKKTMVFGSQTQKERDAWMADFNACYQELLEAVQRSATSLSRTLLSYNSDSSLPQGNVDSPSSSASSSVSSSPANNGETVSNSHSLGARPISQYQAPSSLGSPQMASMSVIRRERPKPPGLRLRDNEGLQRELEVDSNNNEPRSERPRLLKSASERTQNMMMASAMQFPPRTERVEGSPVSCDSEDNQIIHKKIKDKKKKSIEKDKKKRKKKHRSKDDNEMIGPKDKRELSKSVSSFSVSAFLVSNKKEENETDTDGHSQSEGEFEGGATSALTTSSSGLDPSTFDASSTLDSTTLDDSLVPDSALDDSTHYQDDETTTTTTTSYPRLLSPSPSLKDVSASNEDLKKLRDDDAEHSEEEDDDEEDGEDSDVSHEEETQPREVPHLHPQNWATQFPLSPRSPLATERSHEHEHGHDEEEEEVVTKNRSASISVEKAQKLKEEELKDTIRRQLNHIHISTKTRREVMKDGPILKLDPKDDIDDELSNSFPFSSSNSSFMTSTIGSAPARPPRPRHLFLFEDVLVYTKSLRQLLLLQQACHAEPTIRGIVVPGKTGFDVKEDGDRGFLCGDGSGKTLCFLATSRAERDDWLIALRETRLFDDEE